MHQLQFAIFVSAIRRLRYAGGHPRQGAEIGRATMLPSIRLIAATFFCGFVVVYAGLRIAASLNDIHQGLPVMAAHAAPIQAVPSADPAIRRGQSTVPVVYELRFVSSSVAMAPTLASLAPAAPPLDITPPAIGQVIKVELPPPAGSAVAAAGEVPSVASVSQPDPAAISPAPIATEPDAAPYPQSEP
jgi:hypothetical protein